MKIHSLFFTLLFSLFFHNTQAQKKTLNTDKHQELITLFDDWRSFEAPPLLEGLPDYSQATFDKRWPTFVVLKKRLQEISKKDWTASQKADWYILWAEMNGYIFNYKVLKPWQRDPAFYKSIWTYKSDVPAHEGPTHHAVIELWQYSFPLDPSSRSQLISSLKNIPNFHQQAKNNLTGNARDLWITGIKDLRNQIKDLDDLLLQKGVAVDKGLKAAINDARQATVSFVAWLTNEIPNKTGPSGIGKENYTWYQQNVHLVPLSWDDEVLLLKRELARAWSSLKLEEHRNRKLPALQDADSPESYEKLAKNAAKELIDFLKENDIVTVEDYFTPALEPHLGKYIPANKRNFFWITAHYDPKPLFSHFYHWFELARMDLNPHENPIRRNALLYNIFDSRNEGLATAVEEMFMQAGLYNENPRAREIVYILIAQRAARGLGSLYAQANMMSMEDAGKIHSEYTPRGWMKTEKELLIFEQHLYLRQPGYGTSYITGKYLIEETLAEVAKEQEKRTEGFTLKQFFDNLSNIGNIPISLGRFELTGDPKQLHEIKNNYQEL
ncbi:MAG: hypothetical protein ABF273_04920 [Wenyingzhuangia sp.]|uniref:hypothetical protein n=1 Tax=Wenyingzhuangia sp. TaxID=1964193 RepID=UPI0023164D48|nr:hypothetical protein [Flavobacteriaceae bacterium]